MSHADVVALADRLRAARARHAPVLVPPLGGADIAIRGMLTAIGIRAVRIAADDDPPAEQLAPGETPSVGLALGVFKAAQILEMESSAVAFTSFTAVDLETTDANTSTAEVVEIAAVRVRDGRIVDTFSSFVRPVAPMHALERRPYPGIRDADVADAPSFAEMWPRFRDFVGTDVLVAHNGYDFDFPILNRMARAIGDSFDPCTYDSLPLARDLFPTSRKLGDLAGHFGIEIGQAHRALDDTTALAHVMLRLGEMKLARARKTALVDLLGNLGIALALADENSLGAEARLFRNKLTPIFVLGRYSQVLEAYDDERAGDASMPTSDDIVDRLGGPERRDRMQTQKTADERYPAAMQRLRRLVARALPDGSLEEQLSLFLQRSTLSTWDGEEPAHARGNLMTLHATKGLEFSRVYVVGCEDSQLPGGSPKTGPKAHEVEEGRRLLYGGMTRTIDRLVLTYCASRGGKAAGGHQYLDEMGLVPMPPQ